MVETFHPVHVARTPLEVCRSTTPQLCSRSSSILIPLEPLSETKRMVGQNGLSLGWVFSSTFVHEEIFSLAWIWALLELLAAAAVKGGVLLLRLPGWIRSTGATRGSNVSWWTMRRSTGACSPRSGAWRSASLWSSATSPGRLVVLPSRTTLLEDWHLFCQTGHTAVRP